jgi:hypothetical protein
VLDGHASLVAVQVFESDDLPARIGIDSTISKASAIDAS